MIDSDPDVQEMKEGEHRQAIERHEIFAEGVDTDAYVEAAKQRRGDDGE